MRARMIIGIAVLIIAAAIASPLFATDIDSWTKLQNIQSTGTYNLTRNLTTSDSDYATVGANFTPISDFEGTFNGQGHTITGLTINSGNDNVGLFGTASGATIQNVGLINEYVTGGTHTGGLVGAIYSGTTILKSYSTGTINGGYADIGGLVGRADDSSAMTISQCYSAANVTGYQGIGGLVGTGYSQAALTNSYATGSVSGGGWALGGLAGGGYTITDSYATGTVTVDHGAGGLVGNDNSNMVINSFAIGTVNGGPYRGGLAGWGGYSGGATWANGWWYNNMSNGMGTNGPDQMTGHWQEASSASDFYGTGSGTGGSVYTGSTSPWDFTNVWLARSDDTPVLRSIMGTWLSGGASYLGISLSQNDYNTLMGFVSSGSGSQAFGGYTWTYMEGILPGDIGGTKYNVGDIWTYGGHTYLKVGSGFEMDQQSGDTPEPATIVGLGLMVIAAGLRRRLFQRQS